MSNARDLLQLRELYKSGLLTDDEYVTARRKLLGYRSVRIGRPSQLGGTTRQPAGGTTRQPAGGTAPPPPAGNDLPLLFALAALALVATFAAIYFLAFAK